MNTKILLHLRSNGEYGFAFSLLLGFDEEKFWFRVNFQLLSLSSLVLLQLVLPGALLTKATPGL